jgi:GNAT superfamily N-acetyltransferase
MVGNAGALVIRVAARADAAFMAELRSASIQDLCSADHHDDPVAIRTWVGPADKFARLLDQPGVTLVVAEIAGRIVGLGGLSGDTITLNYVHPDYRFQGVSKALLVDLEARLAGAGGGGWSA